MPEWHGNQHGGEQYSLLNEDTERAETLARVVLKNIAECVGWCVRGAEESRRSHVVTLVVQDALRPHRLLPASGAYTLLSRASLTASAHSFLYFA